MRPFTLGITTLVQGLFTAMALLVLADVASPTFNMNGFPEWSGIQAVVSGAVFLTTSLALGVVMHTISRSIFHSMKQQWTMDVLTSESVQPRMHAVGTAQTIPGGPTYEEILDPATPDRLIRAFAFMHGMEYQLMMYAPHVFDRIQVYREQYRLARAFVVPSIIFALTLPFWEPMRALDGVGSIGPFPIIRSQLFMLSALAASVSYVAFRERAYRYAAARTLAYVTLESAEVEEEDDDD